MSLQFHITANLSFFYPTINFLFISSLYLRQSALSKCSFCGFPILSLITTTDPLPEFNLNKIRAEELASECPNMHYRISSSFAYEHVVNLLKG